MPICTAQTFIEMFLLGAQGVWKGQLTLNVAQSDLVTYPGNKVEFVIWTENQNVSNSSLQAWKAGPAWARRRVWLLMGTANTRVYIVVLRTFLFLPILQTLSLASFPFLFYEQIVVVLWFLTMTLKPLSAQCKTQILECLLVSPPLG